MRATAPVLTAAAAVACGVANASVATLDLLERHGAVEQALVVAGDLLFLGGTGAIALTHRHRAGYGRLGRSGTGLVLAAGLVVLLANLATLAAPGATLEPLHALGFLLWLPGSVLLAVAMLRARLLPRAVAVAFALCPVLVWFGPAGQYADGLVWAGLGVLLLQQPASVALGGAPARNATI